MNDEDSFELALEILCDDHVRGDQVSLLPTIAGFVEAFGTLLAEASQLWLEGKDHDWSGKFDSRRP